MNINQDIQQQQQNISRFPRTIIPTSSPTKITERLQESSGEKQYSKQEELEGSDTSLIIMTVAGVATLTMLIIVFATRRRRKDVGVAASHSPGSDLSVAPDLHTKQDRFILPAVTDWNEYARIEIRDDVNNVPLLVPAGLQSAAEINCRGTLTLEKEGNSVVPGSWLSALHADTSREAPYELEASSVDDTSTENFSDSNQGGFPGYIDGAFPTEYVGPVAKYLDSSHIGTVDEHDIEQASSQETDESKSSLNRFISDLVWLEQKIADENAQETAGAKAAENNHQGIELQMHDSDSDSYSYDIEPFSPRSLSDADSTVTSRTASQTTSIVCRDCLIHPGVLDVEIISTKDGPVISSIRNESLLGHLNVGDLIMAIDDCDTRSLTAEQMVEAISSRSSLQRKLTLLHFGGITR